jgi:5-methyltetrahydrofolate--homocysteine methyltransferase
MHVLDASKAVTVASQLISDQAMVFKAQIKEDYQKLRNQFEQSAQKTSIISIEEAEKKAYRLTTPVYKPNQIGIDVYNAIPIEIIRPYIDWSPFFASWGMSGIYPKILSSDKYGEEATKLYNAAQELLDKLIQDKKIELHATAGIFPIIKKGAQLEVYADEARSNLVGQLNFLRQQSQKETNYSLVDYLHEEDYIGLFAVNASDGQDEYLASYKADMDSYGEILFKAVLDRLAEALAEWLHQEVRTQIWGYADESNLSKDDLIHEKYQGIRPAPGYAACPDHTEKANIWEILGVETKIGLTLTENFAMYPTSAVSGYYFASPEAKYIGVGKIGRDQLEKMAKLKGVEISYLEKFYNNFLNDSI